MRSWNWRPQLSDLLAPTWMQHTTCDFKKQKRLTLRAFGPDSHHDQNVINWPLWLSVFSEFKKLQSLLICDIKTELKKVKYKPLANLANTDCYCSVDRLSYRTRKQFCLWSQCIHGTHHQRSSGSKRLFPAHPTPRQDGEIVVVGILSVSHKVKC